MNLGITGCFHTVLLSSSCGAPPQSGCSACAPLPPSLLLEVVFLGSKSGECNWVVAHRHRKCFRRTLSQHATRRMEYLFISCTVYSSQEVTESAQVHRWHRMEFYSLIKNCEMMSFAEKWVQLEINTLGEKNSLSKSNILNIFSAICVSQDFYRYIKSHIYIYIYIHFES